MKGTSRFLRYTPFRPRKVALILVWVSLILAWTVAGPAATIHADALPVAMASFMATCGYSAATASILQQTTEQSYGDWIRRLSGAVEVTVAGQPVTFTTRFSPALFDGTSKAFDYVKEQMLALFPANQVEEQRYTTYGAWYGQTWKNLIVTIPGKRFPGEVIIMSAHLDSRSETNTSSVTSAPGADDNASGSASLMESARLLRDANLDRTVKLVWFTGEEQGLYGSGAFTTSYDLTGVVGDVNLDMFGYDGDNDRCFEMHVSNNQNPVSATRSNMIGQCMASAITNYGLNLKYDYLTTNATTSSDHANFWYRGIGAIEVGQNFYVSNNTSSGCTNTVSDENPNYHRTTDTLSNMNLPYAFSIHQAALATVIDLANSHPKIIYIPLLTNNP